MSEVTGSQDRTQAVLATSHPTFKLIQVLRAVAALMVVVHHAILMLHDRNNLPLPNWINGGAGVDIFFVISGFVMTLSSAPLRHTSHPARTFFVRRIERIVPVYWIATTAKIILLLLVPAYAINPLGTSWHIISSYLFLPSTSEPVLVVGWTLIYEMFFYLLFSVVLALRANLSAVLVPLLVVIGMMQWLLSLLFHTEVPPVFRYYTSNTLILDFLYGILLAMFLNQVRRIPSWLAALGALAGAAILFSWVQPNFSYWRGIQWGIPAAAVVAGALALERTWGRMMPAWALQLGDASYSIYLTHGFVLPVGGAILAHIGIHWFGCVPVSILLLTLSSVTAGVMIYRLLEVPMMRWFKEHRTTEHAT